MGGSSFPQGAVQSRPASPQDPRSIFENAQSALAAGDYKSAESGFRKVLKLDPQFVAGKNILGKAEVVYFSWDAKAHRVRWDRLGEIIK